MAERVTLKGNGSQIRFSEIQDRETLKKYLFDYKSRMGNVKSLVTYTRIGNLIKIIKDGKWRLGNPLNMNDKKELSDFPQADWTRIFYACFMADTQESIAMWSMYGRPWADGVSITIDRELFTQWIRDTKVFYRKENDVYKRITDVEFSLVRVAYTNELTKNPKDSISVLCGKQNNSYIDNIFSDYSYPYEPKMLAGAIKDIAWSYEQEIRIRADYSGKEIPEAIYIDVPDRIIESMIITCGPQFYGNLEYRLRESGRLNLNLQHSKFCSMLKDMPCSEYGSSKQIIECKESIALANAEKVQVSAANLSLYADIGKGTFEFVDKGFFCIGNGEYRFSISWRNTKGHIYLDRKTGRSSYISNIPSTSSLPSFNFYPDNNSYVDGSVVLIVNNNGRLAAINVNKQTISRTESMFELEYKIYVGCKVYFDDNKDRFYASNKQEIDAYERLTSNDMLCGVWWDENSKRCHMTIKKTGDNYSVIIHWSSSAVESTEWTMSGMWNEKMQELVFIDECCITYKGYHDNPHLEVYTEYENGTGRLYLKEGELYWEDTTKNVGKRCRFRKEEQIPGAQI